MVDGELQILSAITHAVAVIGGLRLLAEGLALLARFFEWLSSHSATGKEGTAFWARLKDLKAEMNRKKQGPFWGVLADSNKPLFIDFVSNAFCIAPAGSGKGIYTVVTNIISILASKIIVDLKGELICILKPLLEARNERVIWLNPGGLWEKIIGEGHTYNPVDIITHSLFRPGGLRDVVDDLREIAAVLLPEPAQSNGDNSYWREGSRRIIALAIIIEVMIEEFKATLSSVALLIEDREVLESNLRWILGIDGEGKSLPQGPMPIEQTEWAQIHDPEDVEEFAHWVRARASSLLALMTNPGSKTFDSFVSNAQQVLDPFATGRLAPAMRRSTFSLDAINIPAASGRGIKMNCPKS